MITDSSNEPESGLAQAIAQRTREALASGALQPIETTEAHLEDGGIRFVLRGVSSLLRKFDDQARAAPKRNPFLPYDAALFVRDLPPAHVALLNKFPVIAEHLLVITRDFQPQDAPLERGDFEALAHAMREIDGLAFFNGGREAGASQPHRHLQLVPLPFEGRGPATPIEPVLARVRGQSGRDVAALGYTHALEWLFDVPFGNPPVAGRHLHERYRTLAEALAIGAWDDASATQRTRAYNLLLTRTWMLLIPRSRERFEGISINALGFAGSLFVKDDADREIVRRAGPRAVLRAVT